MNDEPLTADLQRELDGVIAELRPARRRGDRDRFRPWPASGPPSIRTLSACSLFLAVNTQSNSANMGYNLITKYPRADYVCIDAPEARLAVSDRRLADRRYRPSDPRRTPSNVRRSSLPTASTVASPSSAAESCIRFPRSPARSSTPSAPETRSWRSPRRWSRPAAPIDPGRIHRQRGRRAQGRDRRSSAVGGQGGLDQGHYRAC